MPNHLLVKSLVLPVFASVIVLCIATIAGAQAESSIATRFAVIGDRTGDHQEGVYEDILVEIERLKPEFVMTVGDQIEGYTDDTTRLNAEWAEYKGLIKALSMPIHFTSGNHDILSDVQESIYRTQIGEPYYSFDQDGIHFVVVENGRWSRSEELSSKQLDWLANDLQAHREAAITMVFMHKPFWYNSTALGKPDTLHSLFKAYGVDAVFCGHFHEYFSGKYDGIIYTAVGSSGGGANPGPTGLLYHFCWVTVDNGKMTIAPIIKGGVRAWDEVTAEDLRLASRIRNNGLVMETVMVDPSKTPIPSTLKVTVRNISSETIRDTLRWSEVPGWKIEPLLQAVEVEPNGSRMATFTASGIGNIYPVPEVSFSFAYAPGKKTTATVPLLVSRRAEANPAAKPPILDGNLDDPCWQSPQTALFAQDGGAMPTDPVDFYFAYDTENLYLAAKCIDKKADAMTAAITERDGSIFSEDCVGFFLQPDRSQNTGYQVYFSPIGTIFDQQLKMNDDGEFDGHKKWNGMYRVKTARNSNGWSVEVIVPLEQFKIDGKAGTTMGLNFRRKQPRLGASADWQTPIDYNPKTFGELILQ